MKRVMRWLWRLAIFPFASIALYALAAVLGAIVPLSATPEMSGDTPDVTVWLVSGPIHYDFLLPLDQKTKAKFDFVETAGVPISDVRAKWLSVGWGAKEFYTTTGDYSDLRLKSIWRGLIGDDSVMRVDVAGNLPVGMPGLRLNLTAGQYSRLRDSILKGFAGPAPSVLSHLGLTPTDAFFAGQGRFHLFRTCNVWVGERLRMAGFTFGRWTPLPYSVTIAGHLCLEQ